MRDARWARVEVTEARERRRRRGRRDVKGEVESGTQHAGRKADRAAYGQQARQASALLWKLLATRGRA
eukprot:5718450-Prymnesium_polylepis.1